VKPTTEQLTTDRGLPASPPPTRTRQAAVPADPALSAAVPSEESLGKARVDRLEGDAKVAAREPGGPLPAAPPPPQGGRIIIGSEQAVGDVASTIRSARTFLPAPGQAAIAAGNLLDVTRGFGPRPPTGTESYTRTPENGFIRASQEPLATFSVDVDTASFSNVRRFLTPLGSGAMGLTYAALARQKNVPPEIAREDRRQAREWLKKSLATWRELEPDPAFAPPHRKEMRQVEMAAADMDRLW